MRPKCSSSCHHREYSPKVEIAVSVERAFEALAQIHALSTTESAVISVTDLEMLFQDWLFSIYAEVSQGMNDDRKSGRGPRPR